ncbi:MAG TPA: L,D-transpeptidase family protein [Chloroflexota bacterium]|nr:L,D-transpeptidase family protein [Chloroflexota bacterium]
MRSTVTAALLSLAVVIAVAGFLGYRAWTSGPPVVLPAPTQVAVSAGAAGFAGGWTNSRTVEVSVVSPGLRAGADIEVRSGSQTFSGTPTATIPVSAPVRQACPGNRRSGCVSLSLHLADGHYRLQARLHDASGVSPWVAYRNVFAVDTTAPTAPQVSSPTDPDPTRVYHTSSMAFVWRAQDGGSGIDGYSYRLDTDAHGVPVPQLRTQSATVTLTGLDTGKYYFHVRAVDRAGNWGPTSTYPVQIDVSPPELAHVRFDRFTFDPQFNTLRLSFSVTKTAPEVRVGVYRQSDGGLVRLYRLTGLRRGQSITVAWDGKDAHGNPAPAGAYEIYIRAMDQYGHSSLTGWRDFQVSYKRIKVSLSRQQLWAYDGSSLFLTSLVTTGNKALPTPVGVFPILAKFHPFTFRSPWPKSSPFWYPPSLTQWAMLFQANGYFIHDAPWRSNFGPGSNAQLGTPGSNYTGTHGCVNVPANVAQELYSWASIGTIVQIVP